MKNGDLRKILEMQNIEASAPCRIDMGGTLDISTFYYPLRHFFPCTFNLAIDLRTRVRLLPHNEKLVKVTSMGFESVEYPLEKAPFDHPLGLMFAVAAYFGAEGVNIVIESSSPPRSALGGSSAAAVALVAAFSEVYKQMGDSKDSPMGGTGISRQKAAILAHAIEESVAGVPCGLQDQLAAAYGGVNAWRWRSNIDEPLFKQECVVKKSFFKDLERHILLAYCGAPHESKNINKRWIQQFVSGKNRNLWIEIVKSTKKFVEAISVFNFKDALILMNNETAIRKKMTPDVLDDMGGRLVDSAVKNGCGARFTGAGGGGCIWALGDMEKIDRLREAWGKILFDRQEACLLDLKIDSKGVLYKSSKKTCLTCLNCLDC